MKTHSLLGRTFDGFNVFIMILLSILMFYPFLYVFSYSLSDPSRITGGLLVWPHGLNFESYKTIFQQRMLLHSVGVSVARTVIGPFIMIMLTSMAAFVITKENMIGVKFLRKFFVFTMYFNSGLIPLYLVVKSVGLMSTFWVYVIPTAINVFNMILIKTYIESLPNGLEESALIDGANEFVVFWRIIFPLCTPVIAAVILFTSVEQWNMFIDTQIYNAMNPGNQTLQYLLYETVSGASSLEQAKMGKVQNITPETIKMAITIITVLPIAVVYPLLQKHFTKGLLIGSIKG